MVFPSAVGRGFFFQKVLRPEGYLHVNYRVKFGIQKFPLVQNYMHLLLFWGQYLRMVFTRYEAVWPWGTIDVYVFWQSLNFEHRHFWQSWYCDHSYFGDDHAFNIYILVTHK
jgi:hypothetical protein